ncbi:MAG: class I SAM-dependent methyltransferase [Armatimonadetes bacterium]|nr:class I SAM-dependent methyltransferase [Akkermansiaceae bacterium]
MLPVAACNGGGKLSGLYCARDRKALARGRRLVTLDAYPDHGEAYLNTEYAAKIDRRVGYLTPDLLTNDPLQSYDFIFLDAGHRYAEVKHDTELLLPLLSEGGYFLWHDYANWGRFNKLNGVPEYLHELSEGSGLPIARISGSGVAIHCPAWASSKRAVYLAALEDQNAASANDPWSVGSARG